MKRMKKNGGVYEYLNTIGVLETGSDADIIAARQFYWKTYKAAWRKKHRATYKQVTIALTAAEAQLIAQSAYRRSITCFIKESCLAYLRKTYLAPDPLALATIHQLLSMNYNTLQKLFDENVIPFEVGRTLLLQMAELQQKVLKELYQPKECKDAAE